MIRAARGRIRLSEDDGVQQGSVAGMVAVAIVGISEALKALDGT
jgi:hypothetical protein